MSSEYTICHFRDPESILALGSMCRFFSLIYLYLPLSVCVQSSLTLVRSHELQPVRLLCPWDFSDKNTGVAISYSKGSSQLRNQTRISCFKRSIIAKQILYHRAP